MRIRSILVEQAFWFSGISLLFCSPSGGRVDFEDQIKPIFEEKCYGCHGDEKVKGELRLDSPDAIVRGGESGQTLVPGSPNESLIYVMTTYPEDDPDYMPQKGEGLSPLEQSLLKAWIEEGAEFGDGFVHQPRPPTRGKYADSGLQGTYQVIGDAIEIIAELQAAGLFVDTVNHDASRFEVSYTYSNDEPGSFDFAKPARLGESLVKLSLTRTKVENGDLSGLSSLSGLEFLDLSRTGIGDEGLIHLRNLGKLQILNLRDTEVSDEGLKHLMELESLRRVYLWGSQVTDSGAKRLQNRLPDAEVVIGANLEGAATRRNRQN